MAQAVPTGQVRYKSCPEGVFIRRRAGINTLMPDSLLVDCSVQLSKDPVGLVVQYVRRTVLVVSCMRRQFSQRNLGFAVLVRGDLEPCYSASAFHIHNRVRNENVQVWPEASGAGDLCHINRNPRFGVVNSRGVQLRKQFTSTGVGSLGLLVS